MSDAIECEKLRLHVEAIERLESEKSGIQDDITGRYQSAKGDGYDVKTMRSIIRLRKMERQAREEADALLETYRAALGLD